MAERIKVSIATLTGAGSMPATGGIFLRASNGVRKEVPPSPTWAWQIPMGTHLQFKLTIPSPTLMCLSCRGFINK